MKERLLFSTNLHGATLEVGSQVPGGGEQTVLEGGNRWSRMQLLHESYLGSTGKMLIVGNQMYLET